MEEDCGAFAADCVVLSCCCQCLILQVTVFIFFKIPRKLAQKMKKFVKTRLQAGKGECRQIFQPKIEDCKEEYLSGNGFTFFEGPRLDCMKDIEAMLQELSINKEFMFGSFWREGDYSSDIVPCFSSLQELSRIQRRTYRTQNEDKDNTMAR